MNTKQKIAAIKELVAKNKSFSFILKTQKHKEVFESIMSYTKQLNIKFIERVYWYINLLHDYPVCALPGCNCKSTKFLKLESGYKKYCSASCAAKSDLCKQRHVDTCRQKYGVDNVAQCRSVQQKMQKTSLARYGVTNIGAYAPNREKVRATNIKKYGAANGHRKSASAQIGASISAARCTNYYNNVVKADSEIKPLFTLEEYINSQKDTEYRWHCCKCNRDFTGKLKGGKHVARCLNCYPYSESKPEQEVLDVLREISPSLEIKLHDRSLLKPLEVDLYIPSKKLAIEFDGLYWHSDDVLSDRNYHLSKSLRCEQQGIQLVHIFENEWLFKQDIVRSRLKNLLGIYDKTVYARKCEVKEVDSKTSKAFQEQNHIQGSVNSKASLGLYDGEELVSLMTFGKCRFDKKHEWEMLRFCSKLGYHIPGGAGKLLKHFEREYLPKSLVTYADRRWSQGKLYKALGFKLDHISKPDYWYFSNHDLALKSRLKFQKHKLRAILPIFDENKTEVENMLANKYHRIFDCGNLVFDKQYNIL